MRKLILTTTIALMPFTAYAADLRTRSAPTAPMLTATPSSWAGFYVGVGAGAIHSGHNVNDIDYWNTGATSVFSKTGGLAGGTLGYNSQLGALVLGIETDLSYVTADANGASVIDRRIVKNETKWLGTARARMGLALDRSLVYVTSGVAFADVKNYYTDSAGSVDEANETWRKNNMRVGFVAGAGVEYALNSNFSVKGEALYVGFSEKSTTAPNATSDGVPYRYGFSSDHFVARVGVNYKIGR